MDIRNAMGIWMVVGLLVMSGMSVGVVLGEGSLERSVGEGSIAEGTPEKEEGLPEFAGGDGSPANPYQINNWTQLDDVRYNLNDNFILLNDLNNTVEGYDEVVGDPSDPNNEGFDPIGNDSDPFEGSFDGDRYAIEDMWIAKPEKNHCGLFGGASSAEVVDLSMLNASVEGNESVGALIGGSEATQVSNISVNGSVTGNSYIGGIVGVGGSNTVIELSRANVIVDGDSGVGGIIGYTFENLGNGAYIVNTYSVGKISGESKVGGIAGHISLNSALNKSYSLCEVNGVNETGGVVGYNYYVADSMSRASPAVGYNENNTEGRVTSAPKDDLQNIRLYTDDDFENYDPLYKEWNITEVGYGEIDDGSIWNIVNNETYPFFSWEGYAGYNLEIQAGEGGTTDPEPGTHGYGEGTEVTVKALPDEGWSFANWTGDVPESEKENEEITIVMDEDKSIKANFHPLEIYDWKDLYEIRYSLDENYTLMNDLNETTPYYGEYVGDEEKGWKPIGEDGNEFIGTFDGQGYEIRDLYIDRPDEDSGEYYLGLFGVADDGAKIIDLGVVDANVSGEYYVGGLVGNNAGTVSNSYATGNMSGDYYVGGLVGSNDGTIENSYATGDVNGDGGVGALVGGNSGTVSKSYAMGNVSGNDDVGGLVGWNYGGTLSNSYATGNVSGDERVGAIVGRNDGSVIDSIALEGVADNLIGDNQGDKVGRVTEAPEEDMKDHRLYTLEDFKDYPTLNNSWDLDVVSAEKDSYPYIHSGRDSWVIEQNISSEIHDWYDLHDIRFALGGNYTLMNDLNETTPGYDAYASTSANDGKGWKPIGEYESGEDVEFTGTFDGNEYEIRDLYIDRPNENIVGLFGAIDDCEITDLGVVGAEVSGDRFVGGLVGVNFGSTVESSYAIGNVNGEEYVGGLVGVNEDTVTDSYATGDVSGEDRYVGGLVGDNRETVNNSYATGNVSGGSRVGGLVGWNSINGKVDYSYAIGNVSGESDVGGLVGENDGATVSNSFWDTETTGQDESDGGTGKTTAEMKDVATFTDTSTEGLDNPWDFVDNPNDDNNDTDIWDIDDEEMINQGYPFLDWEDVEYELTVYIDGDGSVEVDGEEVEDGWSGKIEEGEEVELKATPSENWLFDGWTGYNSSTEEKINITIDDHKEQTAHFQIKTYELTVNKTGNGSVEIEPEKEEYEHGEEVNLTAVPDEGHHFINWTGDYSGTDHEINITMNESKQITAHFEINTYSLGVEVDGNGSVEIEPEKDEYEHGEEVNLTAVPDEGHHFINWTGAYSGTDHEINITMNESKQITAHFEINTYSLGVEVDGNGSVEIEPEKDEYEHGEEVNLTAVPDEGHHFINWTGAYSGTDHEINITMNESKEITAHFEINTYSLDVTVEGNGSVEIEPEKDEYEHGEEVNLTAVPGEGHHFINWTGDYTGSEHEISITMNESKEITAHFEINTHSLDVEVEGNGSVEIEPEKDEYEHGEEVNLIAIPEEGHHFINWTGDYSGTDHEISITMNESKEITAHFEINTYSLEVEVEGNGSVEIEPEKEEYEYSEEVILTAVPDEGNSFIKWSGDYEGNEKELIITIDENKTITAHFETDEGAYFNVDITEPRAEEEFVSGEVVTVEYTVENIGNETDTQNIEFYVDDELIDTEESVELEIGEVFEGEFTWNASDPYGDRDLTVESVDDHDEVTIQVEEVPEGPYFSIVIDHPKEGADYEENDTVTVEYTVENIGNETGAQDLEFHVDGEMKDKEGNVMIDAGDTFSNSFTWTAEGADEHLLSVSSEDDEENVTIEVVSDEDLEPADLEVHEFQVDGEPSEVTVAKGDEIEINAEVENLGEMEGELVITIYEVIEDEFEVVENWTCTIEGGEVVEISEEYTFDAEGDHVVELSEEGILLENAIVEVEEEKAEETGIMSYMTSWWFLLILGIILLCVVILAVVAKKRRSEPESSVQEPPSDLRVAEVKDSTEQGSDPSSGEQEQKQVPSTPPPPGPSNDSSWTSQQTTQVEGGSAAISTAFGTLGQASKERVYEHLTQEKGVQMGFEEFEEELEKLVEEEKVVRQPQKEGEDVYQWVGE